MMPKKTPSPFLRGKKTPFPFFSGVTLIELVVTLVLASLMMVTLLRITTMVAARQQQIAGEQLDAFASGLFAQRVREDLINARGMAVSDNSIVLAGFVSDQRRPSRVRYESRQVSGRSVLLRSSENQTEIVWLDFGRFLFRSYAAEDDRGLIPDGSGGLPPVPMSFQIAAYDSSGGILFDEVVHHHGL